MSGVFHGVGVRYQRVGYARIRSYLVSNQRLVFLVDYRAYFGRLVRTHRRMLVSATRLFMNCNVFLQLRVFHVPSRRARNITSFTMDFEGLLRGVIASSRVKFMVSAKRPWASSVNTRVLSSFFERGDVTW